LNSNRRHRILRVAASSNIVLKIANGYHGWPEHAPFDKVIVTAAPDLIPLWPKNSNRLKTPGFSVAV
jgi:protein-L-isoaspartate(D-aspartate) O-methyltransferase